jgi:hypothetical protein
VAGPRRGEDQREPGRNQRRTCVPRFIESIDPDTVKVTKVNFELVGIIYECIEMVDTVRTRHIDQVLAVGTLRPPE